MISHFSASCYDSPELCHEEAECRLGASREYRCFCKNGFHGNGRTCYPDTEVAGRTLMFAQGMALLAKGLESETPGRQLIYVPRQIAVGLDYDCQTDTIYWSDVSGKQSIEASFTEGRVTLHMYNCSSARFHNHQSLFANQQRGLDEVLNLVQILNHRSSQNIMEHNGVFI